jgi:hypothetical protein
VAIWPAFLAGIKPCDIIMHKVKWAVWCPNWNTQLYTNEKLSDFFPKCSQFLSYYIVLQFWLSTILIIYTMNGVIWSWRIKQKCQQNRYCFPIGRLFCCSVVGVALKVPLKWYNWDKNWLTGSQVVFLCMKLLLNSTYPMIHSSINYYHLLHMILYSIQWQASHDNWSWYANKPALFE